MAHGFMQSFDPTLQVFSAGTAPASEVNPGAVAAMAEIGLDISGHTPRNVSEYLDKEWDYVITVCGGANKSCPTFGGRVKTRVHIGFDDPSHASGSSEFIAGEFRRVRDEIRDTLFEYYTNTINNKL